MAGASPRAACASWLDRLPVSLSLPSSLSLVNLMRNLLPIGLNSSVIAGWILIASGLAPPVQAQPRKTEKSAKKTADPYTLGEVAALKKVGYESLGPFGFGDGHDTLEIRRLLPTVPLIFIETAHFKIGCALPPLGVPKSSKRKRQLFKEIKALRTRLPRVKSRPRRLDRWLRAHLFAQRLENLYAEMSELLGVKDADFPPKTISLGTLYKDRHSGEGPYLGNRGKFTILLLEKQSNLGRYTLKVSGQRQSPKLSHSLFFHQLGSNFVGITTEMTDGHLKIDHAMHCHTVYCMSMALLMGYKGFRFRLPEWLSQGIAHWHVHRIDPFEHSFRQLKGGPPDTQFDPRWSKNVRGLVKHASAPSFAAVMRAQHANQMDFLDHLTSWSRVDFLARRRPEDFHRFLAAIKDPIGAGSGNIPTFEQVLAQQDRALKATLGYDPAAFDRAWAAFVLETYPRK